MKLKHIIIFIIVISLLGIGYFVFDKWNKYASGAKGAVAYSILAVGQNDTVAFKQHVEIDSITIDVLNNIHLLNIDSVSKQQVVMMSVFNRPALVKMIHEGTMNFIAGVGGDDDDGSDMPGMGEISDMMDPEKAGFELLEMTEEILPGDSVAIIHIKFKTVEPELNLDISLRARKEAGEWQITRINNFVEVVNKVLATVEQDA